MCRFRVQVPHPHPGVQFRRSKRLDDRYAKYAKKGVLVRGTLEDDGDWLKLNENVYLPMRINGLQVLEGVDSGNHGRVFCFACGQGGLEEDEEVMSSFDDAP